MWALVIFVAATQIPMDHPFESRAACEKGGASTVAFLKTQQLEARFECRPTRRT